MTTKNNFEDIIGYEGLYEINQQGQINSLPRWKGGRYNNVYETKKRPMTPVSDPVGYQTIVLKDEYGVAKKYFIHRLVALQYIDNPENKPQVNHKDGVKYNNNIENLEWNTRKENIQHALKNGLMIVGEQSHLSKLKEIDVIVIKELIRQGELTQKQIAQYYKTSESNVSNIKSGNRWAHVL